MFAVLIALLAGLLIGMLMGRSTLADSAAARLKQLGGGPVRYLEPPDATAAEFRRQKLAFFRASTAHGEVVMLGDSHTEAGAWAELLPGTSVLNRGIGWDTTQDVQARLDEVIAKRPRVVFLLIGLVDLRYGTPVQAVADNIVAIARQLQDAGIRVVVQSLLPVSAQLREPTNQRVQEVNARLRASIPADRYLDLHPSLAEGGALDPALTYDQVHLSPPAYLRWAQALKPLIALHTR